MNLETFFKEHPRVALGFSGGVDSSYLLYAGIHYGADVQPYFVKSVFQPAFELDDAKRIAAYVGADLRIIECDVLAHETVRSNPENRCYYCKQAIFCSIAARAAQDGYTVLIDGSNASDDDGDRPGMRAIAELDVLSPLRNAGLTKDDIRKLSKEAGLFTWDKPSYACLATRIPTGVQITSDMLQGIEASEQLLHDMGFRDFRIRVFHGAARIQVPLHQLPEVLSKREDILLSLRPYFPSVLLDLVAR